MIRHFYKHVCHSAAVLLIIKHQWIIGQALSVDAYMQKRGPCLSCACAVSSCRSRSSVASVNTPGPVLQLGPTNPRETGTTWSFRPRSFLRSEYVSFVPRVVRVSRTERLRACPRAAGLLPAQRSCCSAVSVSAGPSGPGRCQLTVSDPVHGSTLGTALWKNRAVFIYRYRRYRSGLRRRVANVSCCARASRSVRTGLFNI